MKGKKTMTIVQWTLAALALVCGAVLAYLYAVTLIERDQARQLASKLPDTLTMAESPRTAVVYFSRSGNTALAACNDPLKTCTGHNSHRSM